MLLYLRSGTGGTSGVQPATSSKVPISCWPQSRSKATRHRRSGSSLRSSGTFRSFAPDEGPEFNVPVNKGGRTDQPLWICASRLSGLRDPFNQNLIAFLKTKLG